MTKDYSDKNITDFLVLHQKQKTAETALDDIKRLTKEAALAITPEAFADLSYDEAKQLYAKLKYYRVSGKFKTILREKKSEKYPELKKAVYYPEINQLDIPDEEKIRLDNALRIQYRYKHIYEENTSKHGLSREDIKNLLSLNLLEKVYVIHCSECYSSCEFLEESELKQYLRFWKLKEAIKSETNSIKTETLEKEYKNLDEAGYSYLTICCTDCDEFSVEITSKEQLLKYLESADICYKVTKQPDLTYESL